MGTAKASDYPDDADGDALRRVANSSADMSKPMEIDYAVVVPDESAGVAVARAAEERGYRTSVVPDESGEWTCYCSRSMLLTYDSVVLTQRELDDVAAPFGGASDGWGTFGN